ncbi:N-acyl homoserine lactonase family protein [Streptococcus loxodontisalivarius]|uniref:Glyoxylase-like metal-dependent hydrolase (Beta-lactamase superfamily II) n=1 Tax=Streptococcus loxodontisalivarius TaxID=1349415 RepID=A0ABS2PRP3_9STRE|nr:N-acyl homoserine lactonase family protein [Streptococcus loxodontisalivarius]MBM7642707.1 glyoxylase-like metal-dependent hydrolase (beta-lactamase superfamily II) [Streptococcus loxodontisalivarius]
MTNQDIKIHVLHTGTVIVDEALPFHHDSDSKIAWTGLFSSKKHQIAIPVSVYLIEHPKGLVLIDTGWHTDNRTNQIKNLKWQYPVNKADLPEGQAVHEQLANLGYKPSDIDYLLLSHLHCDHADGLRLVKDAKSILVSEEEWEAAQKDKIKYLHHEWAGVDVQTFKLSDSDLGPQKRAFDLFGDGSLQMIWIPGHSNGLYATKIQSLKSDDYVLLASDAGYAARSWEENLTPGVVEDRSQAQKSLDWVKTQVDNPNCISVLANHDSKVKPHIITL